MADELDSGEKTEPATPRKRQEAREKGQVARSGDLNTAIVLLAGALMLYFLSGTLATGLSGMMVNTWGGISRGSMDIDSVIVSGKSGLLGILALLAPFAAGLVAVSFLANVMQVGFRVSWKPLELDLTKLDPVRGAKRIVSRRGLIRLIFGLVKLTIVGWILYDGYCTLLLEPNDRQLAGLLSSTVPGAWDYSVAELLRVALRAGIALLVLAILDFGFQRFQHEVDLRMTKQEVREEMKRLEGDPKVKERRRRIQHRLALQRMMQDVPTADVVVTNPTHYACALRYDEESMVAPRLVAKGQDHLAHRIRELAVAHGVPIVEEPSLARSIHRSTEIGEEIPPDLYQPVAEVLSYVYRTGGRSQALAGRSDR